MLGSLRAGAAVPILIAFAVGACGGSVDSRRSDAGGNNANPESGPVGAGSCDPNGGFEFCEANGGSCTAAHAGACPTGMEDRAGYSCTDLPCEEHAGWPCCFPSQDAGTDAADAGGDAPGE